MKELRIERNKSELRVVGNLDQDKQLYVRILDREMYNNIWLNTEEIEQLIMHLQGVLNEQK